MTLIVLTVAALAVFLFWLSESTALTVDPFDLDF